MKRRISVLLALITTLLLLITACGEKESNKSIPSSEVSAVNEFPIVKEPTTLRIFCGENINAENLETNDFTKFYEEKTGIKAVFETAKGDVRQEINLKLASGDYSDVFAGFSLARSEQTAYHEQGVFIDMADLIDENSYYIKKMFDENKGWRDEVAFKDGKILGIPNAYMDYTNDYPYVMWVYKPWLDKLGIKKPETIDEFYDMLVAFRDNDLNGNGKKDEIPLAGRKILGNPVGVDTFIINAFCDYSTFGLWEKDGKVKFTPNTDEYKEGLKFLKKLYDEGLLHMDSFVMDRTRMMSLGENEPPILGCVTSAWTTQFTVQGSESGRSNDYVAISPLKGPSGKRQTPYNGRGRLQISNFNITSSCENPKAAIKWLDWLFSEEAYLKNGAAIGTRKAKEGEIGLDGKQALYAIDPIESKGEGQTVQNERWLHSFMPSYVPANNLYKTAINTTDKKRSQNAYDAYVEYKKYGDSGALSDFTVAAEDAAEYLELRSGILSEIQSAIAGFVIGERSFEKDWDTYVQNLEDLGVKRFVEIAQESIDNE